MPYPEQFAGFQVNGPDTWLEFHKNEIQPKPFGDYDVDIKIECCGVCGSDVHTLNGGWGEQKYPLAVGHGRRGPSPALPLSSPPLGHKHPTQQLMTIDTTSCRNRRDGPPRGTQGDADQGGPAGGRGRAELLVPGLPPVQERQRDVLQETARHIRRRVARHRHRLAGRLLLPREDARALVCLLSRHLGLV